MKKIIDEINKKFANEEFIKDLCNLSNNNPRIVYDNIAKVINYYLITGCFITPLSTIIESHLQPVLKIVYTPSNTRYKNRITINGLNSKNNIPNEIKRILKKLNNVIGFTIDFNTYDTGYDLTYIIYKAINLIPFGYLFHESLDSPTPYTINESPLDYYRKVYYKKVKRANSEITQDELKALERLITYYYNESPCVYVERYPQTFNKPYIILPTNFTIINTCAKNKKISPGIQINPNNAEIIEEIPKEMVENPSDFIPLSYTRYEFITIDENFKYQHSDLTGRAKEDMLILYKINNHRSSSYLELNINDNLDSIKRHNDITLNLIDGVYHIYNGRHRLVYLKDQYDTIRYFYPIEQLVKIKEKFTIPVKVNHIIEDKRFNELLNRLNGQAIVLKDNIQDDNIDIVTIINNHIYFTKGINEFEELIVYLEQNEYNNRFLYETYSNTFKINYDELLLTLHNLKKEKLFQMSFKELMDSLPKEIKKITNPILLYQRFTLYINNEQSNKVFHASVNLFSKISNNRSNQIDIIIKVILRNPHILTLEFDEIIMKLKQENETKNLDEETLIEIMNQIIIKNEENNTKTYQL